MDEYDPSNLAAFERLYASVSKLPQPINHAEVSSLSRDIHERLKVGSPVRVLLSLTVDADGNVETARAVAPPSVSGVMMQAILLNKVQGEVRAMPERTTTDPDVIAAAETIGRAYRFRPAERDGVAVPFPDFRISISFGEQLYAQGPFSATRLFKRAPPAIRRKGI